MGRTIFSDSKLSDESSAAFMDASIDEILAANTTLVVEEKTARSDGKSTHLQARLSNRVPVVKWPLRLQLIMKVKLSNRARLGARSIA